MVLHILIFQGCCSWHIDVYYLYCLW